MWRRHHPPRVAVHAGDEGIVLLSLPEDAWHLKYVDAHGRHDRGRDGCRSDGQPQWDMGVFAGLAHLAHLDHVATQPPCLIGPREQVVADRSLPQLLATYVSGHGMLGAQHTTREAGWDAPHSTEDQLVLHQLIPLGPACASCVGHSPCVPEGLAPLILRCPVFIQHRLLV